MQYRDFGRLEFRPSALGFGCMRLPCKGDMREIDEPLAVEMLRYAIDHGVNYLDSAHGYHGGNSEKLIAKALEGGYRDKVAVATKMPIWDVKEYDDFDRLFGEQLERLKTDRVDFYLLHNLQAPTWPRMRDLGATEWLSKARADGKVGELGFSFHDSFDAFKEIIDYFDGWSFCQVQYNYVNEDVQAGTQGIEYAASKGLGVVVMEPLFGGTLADPPEGVKEVWRRAPGNPSAVDMALQWLWNKPEVSLVLSGMSTMRHVEENVRSADASGVGTMSAADLALVAEACGKYKELSPIPCTKCGYCMPCPHGVNIPENFQLYNNALIFKGNSQGLNRNIYGGLAEGTNASACTGCRECEEKCPQGIGVSEWMPKVHDEMTKK